MKKIITKAHNKKSKKVALPFVSHILFGFALIFVSIIYFSAEYGITSIFKKTAVILPTVTVTPIIPKKERVFDNTKMAKAGKLAYLVDNIANGNEAVSEVWICDADGENRTQITTNSYVWYILGWSPDNKSLLVEIGEKNEPAILEIETKKITKLPALEESRVLGYFWGPDSNIYYINPEYNLVMVSLNGAKTVKYRGTKAFKEVGVSNTFYANGDTLQVMFDTAVPDLPISLVKVYIYDFKTTKLTVLSKSESYAFGWYGGKAWFEQLEKDAQGQYGDSRVRWSVNVDGTDLKKEQVVKNTQNFFNFEISSDGKKMAYSRDLDFITENSAAEFQGLRLLNLSSNTEKQLSVVNAPYTNNFRFSRDSNFLTYTLSGEDTRVDSEIVVDTVTGASTHLCDSGCSSYVWQR